MSDRILQKIRHAAIGLEGIIKKICSSSCLQKRLVRKARGTRNKTMKPITINPIANPFPPAMKILLLLSLVTGWRR
jgi:hypothetical protein